MKLNETLNEALKGVREAYVARAVEIGTKRLDNIVTILENAGWDFNKAFPYPGSNIGRAAYKQAMFAMDSANRVVDRLPVTDHRMNAPRPVKLKANALGIVTREMIQEANNNVDAYVIKLAAKIGADITTATVSGSDIWMGSTLTVETVSGEKQVWTTKCILNTSCLGKLFNQWPTRRAA